MIFTALPWALFPNEKGQFTTLAGHTQAGIMAKGEEEAEQLMHLHYSLSCATPSAHGNSGKEQGGNSEQPCLGRCAQIKVLI